MKLIAMADREERQVIRPFLEKEEKMNSFTELQSWKSHLATQPHPLTCSLPGHGSPRCFQATLGNQLLRFSSQMESGFPQNHFPMSCTLEW